MAITFTKDATSVVFSKGLRYPFSAPLRFIQPEEVSDGGVRYVYDKGPIEDEFDVPFERLPKADYDDLRSFFRTTIPGKLDTFTYTDQESQTHTVRLVDEEIDFPEVAFHLFSGRLRLRKE